MPDAALSNRPTVALPVVLFVAAAILPVAFQMGTLHLTISRLILLVAILPLGLNLIRGRYGGIIFTDISFGLYVIWVSIALAVNNPSAVVQNAGASGVEFLGAYLLGRAFIQDKDSFAALIKLLVGLIAICIPLVLVETLTGTSILLTLADAVPGMTAPQDLSIEKRLGLERVQLSFEHPIHWGLFCTMGVALCLSGLQTFITRRTRNLLTFLICFSGFLSLSSAAILGVCLQLALISWAKVFDRLSWKWLLLFGAGAVCYGVVDLLSNRTPMQVFMSYATFSAHSAYWRSTIFQWGMVNVWENPVFGIGLNDWVRPVWMLTPSIDNFWLLTAMRYGIPAFLLLAAGYLWAIWAIACRSFPKGSAIWSIRRGWVICFAGLSFALTTVHVWGTIHAFVFFLFGSGMWLLRAEQKVSVVGGPRQAEYSRGQGTQTFARDNETMARAMGQVSAAFRPDMKQRKNW